MVHMYGFKKNNIHMLKNVLQKVTVTMVLPTVIGNDDQAKLNFMNKLMSIILYTNFQLHD